MMSPGVRKLALTAHLTFSVGWLGAVAAFLALSITGLTSHDPVTVRSVHLAMGVMTWFVIVPLSLASPVTGFVQSLGTPWGVFRHYWVLAKIVMTIPACAILLLHMQQISDLADIASERTFAHGELSGVRIKLLANAIAALVVLVAATALSVYKPKGMTAYGKRQQLLEDAGERRVPAARRPRWVTVSLIVVAVLVLAFVIHHLAGGGMGEH